MKDGRRRLRRVMRWGVYLCALSSVAVSVLSFFLGPGVRVEYTRLDQDWNYKAVSLRAIDGRFEVEYRPDVWPSFGEPRESGIEIRFNSGHVLFPPAYASWWELPSKGGGGSSVGYYSTWHAPIIYIGVILVALSCWLIYRGRATQKSGGCQSCGYSLEGLTTPTCPECGTTITHD